MILPPALVLTAGLGTRLRPLTYWRAKAAVPVNGDTLVRRVARWLVAEGATDLVLNLHHLPETVAASVGDGSDLGVRVRYSWENPVLGSAGGPRHALPLLRDIPNREPRAANRDTFFIINGDTLTDAHLPSLLARHDASGALVTMALIPNPRPDKYGGVVVSDSGYVSRFVRAGSPGPSFHFIGVQAANAAAFARLEDGVPSESVNTLYRQLLQENPRSVAAWVSDASFRDIGTPADYLDTCLQLATLEGDRMVSSRGTRIDPSARVTRTVVWDDVTIGSGAELTECVVCDGVEIPPGAAYRRAAITRQPGAAGDELMVRSIDA